MFLDPLVDVKSFLSFWVIPRETTALDYIMCTFPYSKMEKVKNTGSELRHPESKHSSSTNSLYVLGQRDNFT